MPVFLPAHGKTWTPPTPAQAEAGNYFKPSVFWNGLVIKVENPAGSVRKWDGGQTIMRYDYGYIRGSDGVDGDEVDCYLGPALKTAAKVYVVHQRKKGDWSRYDEDKCMLGFLSKEKAVDAYLRQYDDPRFLGPVTTMSVPEFKAKVLATKDRAKMIKAHVSGYTKRDGTQVRPYETKRPMARMDFAQDMDAQAQWLLAQAKAAGHADVDAMLAADFEGFMRLAEQWRALQGAPVEKLAPKPAYWPFGSAVSAEHVWRLLERDFGAQGIGRLHDAGILHVVETAGDLPPDLLETGQRSAGGVYDPQGRTAWIIADQSTAESVPRVFLHEIGEHYGLRAMIGDKGMQTLFKRVRDLPGKSDSAAHVWAGVRDAYPEFSGRDFDDLGQDERFLHEVIACMGEVADLRAMGWWRSMVADIRAFLLRLGISGRLKESAVGDLLVGSARRAMRGGLPSTKLIKGIDMSILQRLLGDFGQGNKPVLFLKGYVRAHERNVDGKVVPVAAHYTRVTAAPKAAPKGRQARRDPFTMDLFGGEEKPKPKMPPSRYSEEAMKEPEKHTGDLFGEETHAMPKKEAIAEHERLVNVLNSPSHEDDKAEAKRQENELNEMKSGRKPFKSLSVGDRFHTGKSKGIGYHKDTVSWMTYEKISNGQARVVEVHGSINKRWIGTVENFNKLDVAYLEAKRQGEELAEMKESQKDDGHPAGKPRWTLSRLEEPAKSEWLQHHRDQHELTYYELPQIRKKMEKVRHLKNQAESEMRVNEKAEKDFLASGLPGSEDRAVLHRSAAENARETRRKHADELGRLSEMHQHIYEMASKHARAKHKLIPESDDLRLDMMSGKRRTDDEESKYAADAMKQYRSYYKGKTDTKQQKTPPSVKSKTKLREWPQINLDDAVDLTHEDDHAWPDAASKPVIYNPGRGDTWAGYATQEEYMRAMKDKKSEDAAWEERARAAYKRILAEPSQSRGGADGRLGKAEQGISWPSNDSANHGDVMKNTTRILFCKPGSLLLKTHVSGYTRKDGTTVRPHDDNRIKKDWRDEENWHSRTMGRMKTLSDSQLRYVIQDASEAARNMEQMNPNSEKAGRYRDEAHYAGMELKRRQGSNAN